jgi:hypothetical protein
MGEGWFASPLVPDAGPLTATRRMTSSSTNRRLCTGTFSFTVSATIRVPTTGTFTSSVRYSQRTTGTRSSTM